MAYFERLSATRLRATPSTAGAWNEAEQHISPALGLLIHSIERDHLARRGDAPLQMSRFSADIFGVIPIDEFDVVVLVSRAGRTIELLEAELTYGERTIVLARAWLLQPSDTEAVAGTAFEPIPGPDELEAFAPSSVWPGNYIASLEGRRRQFEPGRAFTWLRSAEQLVADEEVSGFAAACTHLDAANGVSVREDPREVIFPNVDLTAHFTRSDFSGDWLGLDTRVTFGAGGLGLTHSVLHDAAGPLGSLAQSLTVRSR
ncbi:thioesterase family protein [Brevibacterium otitidis]|uniref:Thioesterase family protein n=1 Tax=Brevibacterium otitidis TaxID=53364 RepID=A0ABV5X364_9MICO|nr:thioesterase family protein [Brevibacterium otitidis]